MYYIRNYHYQVFFFNILNLHTTEWFHSKDNDNTKDNTKYNKDTTTTITTNNNNKKIGCLEWCSTSCERKLDEFEIEVRVMIIQTTALQRSAEILKRVLET